jgi:hypothetical protein
MSKTLKEAGIDVLGVTPFCKKVGLDQDMTIEELQRRLKIAEKVDRSVVVDHWVVRTPFGSEFATAAGLLMALNEVSSDG